MKFRAPRCSEAMFLTSFPACQRLQSESAGPPDSAAIAAPANAIINALSSGKLMRMVNHPVGHRLHAIYPGVDRHEPEEREIQDAEYPCEQHVGAFRRLQAEVSERDEGNGEDRQRRARDPPSIAHGLHRRAIE